MFLAIIVCWLFVDNIDAWVEGVFEHLGIQMKGLQDVLAGHKLLNCLLTSGTIIVLIVICVRRFPDRHLSCVKIALAFCLLILLWRQTEWIFASTVLPFLAYNDLIALGMCAYLLVTVWSLIKGSWDRRKRRQQLKPQKGKVLSLSSDKEADIEISGSRSLYASDLVDRMLVTDVTREAFAIGICGQWGSGKTLFMNEIRKVIKDKAITVEFNPWNSNGADHLLKDFMGTLAQCLSPHYRGISSPISKYVSSLYRLRFNVTGNIILQLSPKQTEKDIAKRKEEIEGALDKIGKPVVVFIDDVDRMEGKEIFEMLRIIRNTAEFRNVYYVVSYDKSYVVDQLSQIPIGNGEDYLEKIFQMEVQMPKSDEMMLVEEVESICRRMSSSSAQYNSLFSQLNEEDYRQMVKVLSSFRKAKRFARQFAFDADYMRARFKYNEYEIRDLLFLNLIEYCDYQLYMEIWQNPETLFDMRVHPRSYVRYYSWPKEANNGAVVGKLSPESEYWMNKLFGGVPRANSHSIQYVNSFYNYFYLAQAQKDLDTESFLDMLHKSISSKEHNGMNATIQSWVVSKNSKSFDSIFNSFAENIKKPNKDLQECKKYLHAAFYWLGMENRALNQLKHLLPRILDPSLFSENQKSEIKKIAGDLLKKLANGKNFPTIAVAISELYRRLDAKEKLLIDIKDVESALDRNLNLFFMYHVWDPILLFVDDGNLMRSVIGNYCVRLKSKNNHRVNLAIDKVIAYYSEEDHKSYSYVKAKELRDKIQAYELVSPQELGLPDLTSIFGDEVYALGTELLAKCVIKGPRQ